MALRVIGSGFPRTGTLSLKLALNQLGLGPCYHASEMLAHPDRMALWLRAGEGDADWDAIFEGYRSTTDAPACYFWRELIERYPDAKVLHSVRDPAAWFESGQATVFGPHSITANPTPATKPFVDMLARRRGGRNLQDRDEMLAWFESHTAEVRTAIPAERLLVYEVSQGWGPLCAFLGVPAPDKPFPRVNERAKVAEMMAKLRDSDGEIDPERMREALGRLTQ